MYCYFLNVILDRVYVLWIVLWGRCLSTSKSLQETLFGCHPAEWLGLGFFLDFWRFLVSGIFSRTTVSCFSQNKMLTSYFPLWRKVRSGLVCNYTRELPILDFWLCVCLKTKFHPLTPNRKCPDCLSCQTKGPSRAAAAAQRTATIVLPHRFVLKVAVIVDSTGFWSLCLAVQKEK